MSAWYGQVRYDGNGGRKIVVKPENTLAGLVRKEVLKGRYPLAGISDVFEAKDRAEAMEKFRRMVRAHIAMERVKNTVVVQISPFMRRRQEEARRWIAIYEKWEEAA